MSENGRVTEGTSLASTKALLNVYYQLIENNYINVSVQGGCTYRNLIRRVASGGKTPIPVEFLSPVLSQKKLRRGRTVSEPPRGFFSAITRTFTLVHRHSLNWWVTEHGLRVAEEPPRGVSYVDQHGVPMSKRHEPIRLQAQRSSEFLKLREAIRRELLADPGAKTRDILDRIDEKGEVEVPCSLRKKPEHRTTLVLVYLTASARKKNNLQSLVSKVREDINRLKSSPRGFKAF